MYDCESEILYSVCMEDEQKDKLEDGLVAFYLNLADENLGKFGPLYEGYTMAYASPRWDQPVLVLMTMHEGELLTHSFFRRGNLGMYSSDPMAHSWYQRLSSDFSVGLDRLRAATEEVLSENLRQKAMETTFCSCMAREYAQWRVDGDSEFVPVVRAVFADYVAEHGNRLVLKYGDLLKNTYWLFDRDSEGTWYLQIIGFDGEKYAAKDALQRVVLSYDGNTVTEREGSKLLTGLVFAVCADSCTEENLKNAEDSYASLARPQERYFCRLSAAEDGKYVFTTFMRTYEYDQQKQDFTRSVIVGYPTWSGRGCLEDEMISMADRTDGVAEMLEPVLAMDFGALELGEDEVFLLDYLKVFLTNENDLKRWNLPAGVCERGGEFSGIGNVIRLFWEELERDPALKDCFWEMEQWTLKKLEEDAYSVSGMDSTGQQQEVTIRNIQGVVDSESWLTTSRKDLRELAEAGENSELVPEELREQFVTYALRESWLAKSMSGEYGSAQWFWSITESGNVMLEVHSVNEEQKAHWETYQYDTILLAEVDGTVFLLDHIPGGCAGAPAEETVDMETETETVSYVQAVEDISALIGADPQTLADYAEKHGVYSPGAYQLGWDGSVSYAVAWELLCQAVQCDPDYLHMTVVDKDPSGYETSPYYHSAQDDLYNLYTWGVLYGDAPKNWFAEISAEEFDELLLRAGSPELRLELLPDKLTLLSWKLDEVSYCSCIQTNTRPKVNLAKEGLIAVLSDWEGLDRALECSYWIQERKGNVDYLNMFTGMEDGTISFTRCKYDRGTAQGEILETRTLEPYDLYGSDTDILRCVCMTDEQKERLDQEFLEQYLTSFREYSENPSFFEGYTVAYAWPLWEEPALMLIALHEGKLRSQTISWRDDDWREDKILWYSDVLAHSWYHIYSNTYYTGW